ncbi:MAG: DUF371 domain-containing protein [Candidatus Kariarchaeaceae archaeon]|jgi:hypothetical protein
MVSDTFTIYAKGHKNIQARHNTTWQLTRESVLSTKGDCIVAIASTAATADFPTWLKKHLQEGGKVEISFLAGGFSFQGFAWGDSALTLDDPLDIVFRKSDFISPRTAGIRCSFTAKDLPETIVKFLQNPNTKVEIILARANNE